MEKRFGIIGLGKIGGSIALHAMEKGYTIIGHDLYPDPALTEAGVHFVSSLAAFREALTPPRCIFLWIPAGVMVDAMAEQLAAVLEQGDYIIDGGNSYWGDSKRRALHYAEKGLHFLDLGTSGGVEGARHAPCFMIGGQRDAVAHIEPILQDLAIPGGYVHAGKSGAGHYVKLVHNGIEFGMLQAIGEGIDLLKHFPESLAVSPVLECWRHGSVIRSWLIDLMARAYRKDETLAPATGYIEDTGEVNWLVSDAMMLDVAIPVIAQSVMMLLKSRDEARYADKAIVHMRHEFGGHPYGPLELIRIEREEGRVGPSYRFKKEQGDV